MMSRKRMYVLVFPERLPSGAWRVVEVINSQCLGRKAADVLLSNRKANGDAFPGERVARAKAAA